MPVYRYRATGRDGKPRQGVVEARDEADAQGRLSGRGWSIQMLQEARLERRKPAAAPPPPRKRRATLALGLLLLLLAAGALVWFDPYGWFAAIPLPRPAR